jgi:hypothetical protein
MRSQLGANHIWSVHDAAPTGSVEGIHADKERVLVIEKGFFSLRPTKAGEREKARGPKLKKAFSMTDFLVEFSQPFQSLPDSDPRQPDFRLLYRN